jgi:hypothetical protein
MDFYEEYTPVGMAISQEGGRNLPFSNPNSSQFLNNEDKK